MSSAHRIGLEVELRLCGVSLPLGLVHREVGAADGIVGPGDVVPAASPQGVERSELAAVLLA
jgi:hypothetical protein